MNHTDERVLLLLGLLSIQPQHGYQINEFIDRQLGHMSHMKRATAYALLTRLEDAGLIRGDMEQAGNRPARRVYSITDAGRNEMFRHLEKVLGNPTIESCAGNIGVMFIDYLDRDVAVGLIEQRIAALNQAINGLDQVPPHDETIGVNLGIDRQRSLLLADRDWFLSALERVRQELPEHPLNPGAFAGRHPEAQTPSSAGQVAR